LESKMNNMSEDAKAILLLCGHFGGASGVEPLTQKEYTQTVRWLLDKNMRPSDLLIEENTAPLALESGISALRLNGLLKRGVKLGFVVEQWNRSGIWVLCRSDEEYPARYKNHLKDKAPPILYGAGDKSLLQGGGLAIVGSRNVDAEGEAFARDVALCCAREGLAVVSGGAKGVDLTAMSSALEAGGSVVGVLSDSLLRRSVERETRRALAADRLVLLSPYHPEASFTVGNAMGRNKLIYGLADYGVVVSSDYNKGGTWECAIEELRRENSLPVFIRRDPNVPKGNLELLKRGGIPFPSYSKEANIREALAQAARTRPSVTKVVYTELPLTSVPAVPVPSPSAPAHACQTETIMIKEAPVKMETTSLQAVLDTVKPLILRTIEKPMPLDKLAKALNVRKVQMQDWVAVLLSEGVLVEQTKRKIKHLAVRKPDEELGL
jgi:predicted Rossmann fold nucleotide-binding protein DprA/Smf involved in DNA uptake